MAKNKDDLLWKGIIEDVFEDFLTFLYPNTATELDFSRGVQFLDKELEQVFPPEEDQYHPKVIDKLVKVFTRKGNEEWVLIHIEVQGKYSEEFGRRMFMYYVRIFDKYQKQIAAFAILTEHSNKKRSDTFTQSYLGTHLTYQFNVCKLADYKEEDLLVSSNPFAFVLLTAKLALKGKGQNDRERDDLLLGLKTALAKDLLSKDMPKSKIRMLMNFLKYYVRFSDDKKNVIFEQQLEILKGRSNTMGIEELLLDRAKHQGKVEGKVEGKLEGKIEYQHEMAREMLNDGLSIDKIMKFTKLTEEEIQSLK